jgi:hypothetical protein
MRRALALLTLIACAWPAAAAAEPVSGAYGTIENQFTTTQPGAPSGGTWFGRYHAPNDPSADPPYMRKMTFYPPPGLRYDTSVPDQCTASDAELALRGPDACPPGSRLGSGTTVSKFMGESQNDVVLDLFNNEDEQIILARSPLVTTVARGKIAPDMSVTFASPTCWPTVGPTPCPVDTVLQIESRMTRPVYTRGTRTYMTTPPKCPKSGEWRGPVKFWWADGGEETIVTKQPCSRRPAKRTRWPTAR